VLALVLGAGSACRGAPAASLCNDDDDCSGAQLCLRGVCTAPAGEGEGEGEGEGDQGEGEEGEGEGEGEGEEGEGEGEGEEGEGEGEGEGEVCTSAPVLTLDAPSSVVAGVPTIVSASAVDDRGAPLAVSLTGEPDLLVRDGQIIAGGLAIDASRVLTMTATDRCGSVALTAASVDVTPPPDCSTLQNGAPGAQPSGVYPLFVDGARFDSFCAFPDLDPVLDGYALAFKATDGFGFGDGKWTNNALQNSSDLSLAPSNTKTRAAVSRGFDLAIGMSYDDGGTWSFLRHTPNAGGISQSLVSLLGDGTSHATALGRSEWIPLSSNGFSNEICASSLFPDLPRQVRFGVVCGQRTIGVGRAGGFSPTVGDDDTAAFGVVFTRSPDFRAFPPARSCFEHRERGLTVSGRYVLDADEDVLTAPVEAHCEMALDGGGWTLVGRSDTQAAGGSERYGWLGATGAIDDFGAPYALGAGEVGLDDFREVLIARRTSSVVPAFYAAALEVDGAVLLGNRAQLAPVSAVRDLIGGCVTSASTMGPATVNEFLVDNGQGLGVDVVSMTTDDCSFGPSDQGLVYVR
jgi:hypothetical protein